MAKKKNDQLDPAGAQNPPVARRRTSTPRRKATGGAAEVLATPPITSPAAEPPESAADMSVAPASSDSAAGREPTYDEIAEAAYRRYQQRGGNHGRDFDDWVEAERELRTRR